MVSWDLILRKSWKVCYLVNSVFKVGKLSLDLVVGSGLFSHGANSDGYNSEKEEMSLQDSLNLSFLSHIPWPLLLLLLLLSRISCVWLCVTPWTAAQPAPLSTGFSRQEYWRGLPFPSPLDPWALIKYNFHHWLELMAGGILGFLWERCLYKVPRDWVI